MNSHPTTPGPAVRLGATYGYRFTADSVELNATFHGAKPPAFMRVWALQLWACPVSPERSGKLAGVLVAEAALPPMSELAGMNDPFVISVTAQPPADRRDHVMVLALTARRGAAFDEVHDLVSFPKRERFDLPRFTGSMTYRGEPGLARLFVGGIENPRAIDTLSGTLAVELWALPGPYAGGPFQGIPVAGTILGSLEGQSRWDNLTLDLPAANVPLGSWRLVAMVREWTGAGYTTRDFADLGSLTVTPAEPAPARAEPVTAPAARPRIATGAVSINTSTLEELAGVKGLPRAVAERIVAGRPFAGMADLLRVKGMGEKLLARIQSGLRD